MKNDPEGFHLDTFKRLLEDVGEELKDLWRGKGANAATMKGFMDYCLYLATRPLEEHEDWDEMAAEPLKELFDEADKAPAFRNVVDWADDSKDLETRMLLMKIENEKHWFFINLGLEHLDGVAYRLFTWLNARNSLIQAHRNS